MIFKEYYLNLKLYIHKRRKLIIILSLVLTLLFSFYNRIIGITQKSLWHESISIYYFLLVLIKSIVIICLNNSTNRKKDLFIFKLIKFLLFILNVLLIVPIILMIINKRIVKISFILSIAVALYVTIKTSKVIITYIKQRKETNILLKELRVIDLMDVVVSILTLQNTLIAVNSEVFDIKLYYLTVASSILGLLINLILIISLKLK